MPTQTKITSRINLTRYKNELKFNESDQNQQIHFFFLYKIMTANEDKRKYEKKKTQKIPFQI